MVAVAAAVSEPTVRKVATLMLVEPRNGPWLRPDLLYDKKEVDPVRPEYVHRDIPNCRHHPAFQSV